MKTCTRCNKRKSKEEFVKLSNSKDGYRNLCKVCHSKNMTSYSKIHPEKAKAVYLKSKYNLTLEEYNTILKKQNNSCSICKIDFKTIKLKHIHIDHCHITGKVRGILCHSCNTALGLIKDNKETLLQMVKYLSQ